MYMKDMLSSTSLTCVYKLNKQEYTMLKLSIKNNAKELVSVINNLNSNTIKSRLFYPKFGEWFNRKFISGLETGERDIISVSDKKYGTLVGFCLLKRADENKICNLSPLLDGVGITQTLLDSAHLYFTDDYLIDVPLLDDTKRLHSKLRQLGFEIVANTVSYDLTKQVTYSKVRNIGWV